MHKAKKPTKRNTSELLGRFLKEKKAILNNPQEQ